MRLLLLDQFSDLGGAQQSLLELLPAVRGRGWQTIVGIPGEGEMFARIKALGFEAEPIDCGPYESGRKSTADIARFAAGTPRLVHQIRALAARFHPDLLYCNGPRVLPAAALAALECPALFHSHSYLGPGMLRRLAGNALRKMQAHVVGQCRFVAEPWQPYVGADRVQVIYNGVAGPARPLPRPAHAAPRVGCIGRIAPEKGQLDFVAAAELVHHAIPECRFIIHGATMYSDPAYEQGVRAAAAGLPLDFAGWTRDIYAAMQCLDVLLVPSSAVEATTRVILEAFAAGLPVIAFRVGGIPEVVDHGSNGLLVDSPAEMARACVAILQSDPLAISQAARATWERRFTLERHHHELLDALESAARS